ncbi:MULTISPECIES: hypothetical protein [unclassified Nonomuraea]|uniref:hypothetical protein n=1 Tax=unclassified Nonomuraea TaxID=2593643 RepID=UPI0033C8C9A1
MTELSRFSDAYASMTVAVYQPLTVRWVSGWTLGTTVDLLVPRFEKARSLDARTPFSTAASLLTARNSRLPDRVPVADPGKFPAQRPVDPAGNPLTSEVRPVELAGFPDAVLVAGRVHPYGIVDVSGEETGNVRAGVFTVPVVVNRRIGFADQRVDPHRHRAELLKNLMGAVNAHIDASDEVFAAAVADNLLIGNTKLYEFFPVLTVREALSPIGIAHYYRQLYFHTEEGVGPLEEAFTIAPNETLEIMYESVRRQVHEELVEHGSEFVSESAIEARNTDEVSDKTSSMVQRDSSAAMSANASGSIGVYSAGATATASFALSAQQAKEQVTRRLKDVTTRASERITKSLTVRTRSLDEVTSTNMSRRVIQNTSSVPVSYGLRRVLRKVNVKVQELGPRLVWQLYLRNPGSGLARSRFVHFREAEPITVPDLPPGVRPRPKGGTDTGTITTHLESHGDAGYYAKLRITTTGDRKITGVTVDSVTDLEGGGKDDEAPAPRNEPPRNAFWHSATHTYTADVAIAPGDSDAIAITYTYAYEPSAAALAEWNAERKAAVAAITEQLLNEQFERQKAIITERSKIRPRPANELRVEERYEAMNRLVSSLFGRGDDPSEPTPLEIEYFHRYFDIDGMFVYMHPSWWVPRFTANSDGFPRPAYEITADSEPAPLGRSLGWCIQLDGDNRRNEFLNSPWYRICLPIRAGREREAIAWLASHVEGEIGYDPTKEPLSGLLAAMDGRRANEAGLGVDGPDWVTVDATVGAPPNPLSPEGVYPVVQTFDVTVPTEGFVYDEITISTS